jgi:small subunit ribosomal protein S8
MHTDPIADMISRIMNAIRANKKDVEVPLSTIKVKIAEILKKEGYIDSYTVVDSKFPPKMVIKLKYFEHRKNVINEMKRISKPGRRIYSEATDVPEVLNGLGIAIISTNSGLLTSEECKSRNVGGEILLTVS